MIETVGKPKTHYLVAVYWSNGGYGGVTEHETESEARTQAEKLVRLGYGKKDSPIHIRRIEKELVAIIRNGVTS